MSVFTGTLAAAGVRISMDGRGRWMDNVFIERLWHDDIYLKGYAEGREARAGIGAWIAFYSPLYHTHLAMPAIEKGFADQDAVAQGVLRCCGRDGQPHLPLCCRGRRG
jgi:hypothetical protein